MTAICVAVCTHDRPELLEQLLINLAPQVAAAKAGLVVVDNGTQSAQAVVKKAAPSAKYHRLEQQGLVPARNAALRLAVASGPDFIAFIDDDEVPDSDWLASLLRCLERTKADICCGPLRPNFQVPPPRWAKEGGFFAKSGRHIGTGNIMFRSAILPANETHWFQTAFSHIGGEDEELFVRLITNGARFVTCSEAWVSEAVPAERLSLAYMLRTGLRDGAIAVALARTRHKSLAGAAAAIASHMLSKLGYGLAHLLQLWRGGWHGVAAMRDACEAAGALAALFGWRSKHY